MTKDGKVLLAIVLLCTVFLAVFMFVLQMRFMAVNLQAAQALNKEVQGKATELNTTLEKMAASPTATATASASGKVKATVKATPAPTPTEEAEPTPEQ